MSKQYYVYILTNFNQTVLYIGVTNDIRRRVWEHREKIIEGFTKRYNISKLVYYEVFDNIRLAIEREKQLKHWSRGKKESLIIMKNADWNDLYDETLF